MKDKLAFYLFKGLLTILKWTPFALLYICSNIAYLFLYRLLRYRRQIVQRHLQLAFPQHTTTERKQLEKKIYRNLADVSLESLKGYSMTHEQLTKRWNVTNADILQPYYDNNRNIIFVTAHFLNWEWGIVLGNQIPYHCIGFYKPIHNRYINDYLLQCRSNGGCELCSTAKAGRAFIKHRSDRCAFALIADQHPGGARQVHWMNFLKQDTAVILGPEQAAKKLNYPVFYASGTRKKRGYYEIQFTLITDTPKATADGEITEQFMRLLEQDIQREPESWLWTHRRWKLKRTNTTKQD